MVGRHSSKYPWIDLGPDVWTMTTWFGQEQLVYRVERLGIGWHVHRWVAGAAGRGGTLLAFGLPGLLAARQVAEADVPGALM